MASPTLSLVDYVLLAILLLSSIIIGVIFGFFKSKRNSAKEFLLANGGMGVFPTALSIAVSFLSAITLLGTPSAIYLFGTMYFYQGISVVIASIIAALVFMPKFREMNFTSTYEYLEQRFDRAVRICVSTTFSTSMLIYMAIVLYAPALALSQTTGLNIWLSVISIGVICTFYSSVGGIKAVIFIDVLQTVVIFTGLLTTIIQGLIAVGGLQRTLTIAWQGGRIIYDRTSVDPRTQHTIWAFLIGGSFNFLGTYAFNQTLVQRYICVRSTRAAKQALYINAVSSSFIILSSCFIGVIIYAYYADCDPYSNKQIEDVDQIFPYFIMEVLGHRKGFPGVFLACIFSGSLSTISSGLNSLAAVLIEDFYKGLLGRSLTDERQGFLSKIISVVLGAVVMLLTYIVSYLGSILNAGLSLFGVLEGPIMGVFMLGLLFPRANRGGGLVGFLVGLAFMLWIFLGAQITHSQMAGMRLPLSTTNCVVNSTMERVKSNWTTTISESSLLNSRRHPLVHLYSVSFMWYTPIAVFTVMLVGLVVSYLTGPRQPHEINPKLIIPVCDMCCACLPEQWRKWLRCGITQEAYLEVKRDEDEQEMTIMNTSAVIEEGHLPKVDVSSTPTTANRDHVGPSAN